MSAALDAIGSWLVAEGVAGGSTGWVIHKLGALEAPDQTVTLYETGGPAPEQATDRRWMLPTYQVVTRSKVQVTAASKMADAFDALDRADIPGFSYFVAQQSTPIALGPDAAGRFRFALNFRGGLS